MTRSRAAVLGLAALLASGSAVPDAPPPVRVRTSASLATCVRSALAAARPGSFVLEVGDAAATDGADVVIDEDVLLGRALEGGQLRPDRVVNLGFVSAERGARELLIVAAPIPGREMAARALLDALASQPARDAFASCAGTRPLAIGRPFNAASAAQTAANLYAQTVVDFWTCGCALENNSYVDPQEALGPPDAENLGGKDLYRGMVSLGQGGYVILDMGVDVADGRGSEFRVYQTTSGEPVTVYASASPSGPFVLLGLQQYCGYPSDDAFSNHCDFDLAAGGLASARYVKVEDGEIYPCLAGTTRTEGADIDAVQALHR